MGYYMTSTSMPILMVGVEFDTATSALAAKMIVHAEAEVDKYLSKRYDLTAVHALTPAPPLLTSLSETLAEGYMWLRMARGGSKEAVARAKDLINLALDNLKLIADYQEDVVDNGGNPLPEGDNSGYRILSSTSDYAPTFNEDSELNWTVDEQKILDIASERSRNG